MASKPRDLVARFLSDVQGFLRGSDQMADALEDTVRDLDKVADAGDDSARRLARAYDRAGDEMRRDMADSTRSVKGDVADTGKEAGAEFAQNLGQSLASGDSSRIVQDSVGGLIGSLALAGPLGAVVAAGGAIALGLWNAFEQKTKEQKEAVLAAAGELYQGLIDQGVDFVKEFTTQTVRDFFDPSMTDTLSSKARAASKLLGDNLGNALAGGPESIAAYADEARSKLDDMIAAARAGDAGDAAQERIRALKDEVAYLDTIVQGLKDATEAADDYAGALQTATWWSKKAAENNPGGSTYRSQLGAAAPYATGSR
jgi:hypothetical protein